MLKGLGNIGKMLGDINNLQKMAKNMQAELSQMRVESVVGGGAVKVIADGNGRIINITIDPTLDDIKVIEGLLMNCINDAMKKVKEEAARSIGKLTGSGQIPGIENILKNFM